MLVPPGKVLTEFSQENSMSTFLASLRTLQPDEPHELVVSTHWQDGALPARQTAAAAYVV
jgi:hypothetical protein